MRIVVTGNIGAGKSTVCSTLSEILVGHEFVSVDKLVHELYENEDFKTRIRGMFGTDDRHSISAIVFADPVKRDELQTLSLEFLSSAMDNVFKQTHAVIEFPLFFEIPAWRDRTDFVIFVGCDEDIRKKRAMARDGMDEETYEKRKKTVFPQEYKKDKSDCHIDTGGSLEDTIIASRAVAKRIMLDELDLLGERSFAPDVWMTIRSAYDEPHRKYHTRLHLAEMFERLRRLPLNNPRAVHVAVWIHDLVYSVAPGEYPFNESRSVDSGVRLLDGERSSRFDKEDILLGLDFALSTKGHAPIGNIVSKDVQDCLTFLDCDLAVIGSPWWRFSEFERQIAEEFGRDPDAPDIEYIDGRRRAMRSFAERERIFVSGHFEELEEFARNNLARLDKHLSSLRTSGDA